MTQQPVTTTSLSQMIVPYLLDRPWLVLSGDMELIACFSTRNSAQTFCALHDNNTLWHFVENPETAEVAIYQIDETVNLDITTRSHLSVVE